ncbi:MAG: hypothetical protein GY830_05640 [Bacteroidetes bacterium]|nr:hypothetical protein [Bacteroidota bacterium]
MSFGASILIENKYSERISTTSVYFNSTKDTRFSSHYGKFIISWDTKKIYLFPTRCNWNRRNIPLKVFNACKELGIKEIKSVIPYFSGKFFIVMSKRGIIKFCSIIEQYYIKTLRSFLTLRSFEDAAISGIPTTDLIYNPCGKFFISSFEKGIWVWSPWLENASGAMFQGSKGLSDQQKEKLEVLGAKFKESTEPKKNLPRNFM